MKKNTSGVSQDERMQGKPATTQPYRKPRVTVYGDLRTITQKAGTLFDGFQKPATRK